MSAVVALTLCPARPTAFGVGLRQPRGRRPWHLTQSPMVPKKPRLIGKPLGKPPPQCGLQAHEAKTKILDLQTPRGQKWPPSIVNIQPLLEWTQQWFMQETLTI